MPRIDPTRLLCCLKPLLNLETGGIKSERDVDKLFGLMSKFSKKLVSKCTYINILSSTSEQVLNVFMERGGWQMVHEWLIDAKTNKNHQLLNEILNLLLHTPASINRLKENTLPKEIKQISSKWEKEDTKILAVKVVNKWISIAKNESQQQTSLSSHGTSSIPIATSPQLLTLNHPQQQQQHLPTSNNISNTSSGSSFIVMQNNNNNMSMGHQQLTQMSDSINTTTSTVVNPSVNNNSESNNLVGVGNQTGGLPFERDPSSSMEIDGNYDYMNDMNLQIQDSELNMMDVMDNFNPDLFTKTIDQLDNFTENDNNFQLSASNSGNNNNNNMSNPNNSLLLNDMGLQQQQSSQLPFLSSTEEPSIPSIVIKSSGGQHSIVNSSPNTPGSSSIIPNSIGSENVQPQDSQSAERICYVVHNGQKFLLKLPSQPITSNCQTIGIEKGNMGPNNHHQQQQQQIQLIMTQDQQVTSSSASSVPAVEIVTQTGQESTIVSDGNVPPVNQISPTKRRRPRKDPTITNRNSNDAKDTNPVIISKGTVKSSVKKAGDPSSSASTTTINAASEGTSVSKNDSSSNKVPDKDKSKLDSKVKSKSTKDSSHKSSSSSSKSSSSKSSSSSSKSSSSKRSSSSSKAALEAERAEEEKIRQQTKEARKKLKERELEKKKSEELEKQKQKDSKTLQETYGATAKLAKIPKIPNKKKDQPSFTDLIGVPGAKDEPIKKVSKDVKSDSKTTSKSTSSNKDSSSIDETTITTTNSGTTENSGTIDVGFGAHAKPETSKPSSGAPIRRVKVFQSAKSKNQDILDTMLEATKTKSKTDIDSSNTTTTTSATTSTTITKTPSTVSFEAALMGATSSSNRKSKTLSPDSGKDSKRLKLDNDSNSRTDKKDGKSSTSSSSSSSERRKSSESKKSEDKSSSSSKDNKTTKSAIQESSFFMDSINATRESSKSNKKPSRIRRLSSSTDESKSSSNLLKEQASSSSSASLSTTTAVSSKEKTKDDTNTSTTDKITTPVFNFYRDTLNDDDDDEDNSTNNTTDNDNNNKGKDETLVAASDVKDDIEKESIDIASTPTDTNLVVVGSIESNKNNNINADDVDVDKNKSTGVNETNITSAVDDDIQEIQDDFAPVEGEGKLKSCLCIHRPKGKPKKAVKWREEDELKEFHFFEMDETERVNVSKQNRNFLEMKQQERSEEKKSIQRKSPLPGDSMEEKVSTWPAKLQKLWIDPENPVPEDLSREKRIQEEREQGILQVFYFPGTALPDCPSEIDVLDMEIDRNLQPKRIPDENIPGHTQYYDLTKVSWPVPKYQNNRERMTSVINPIMNNPLQPSSISNPPLSLPTSLSFTQPPPVIQQQMLNNLTNPMSVPNLGFPTNPVATTGTNNYSDIFNPWNQALAAASTPTNDPWKIAAESSSVPGFLPPTTGIIPPFGFNFPPPPQIPSNFPPGIPGQFGDLSTGTNLNISVGPSNNSRNLFNNNNNSSGSSSSSSGNSNPNQITRARDMDYRDLGSRRSNHDDRSSDRGDRDRIRESRRGDRDTRESRSNRDRDYRDRHSSSSSYDKDRDYRHSDRGSYSRGRAPNGGRRLCSYFAKGFCREGHKCTFLHPSPASSSSSHDTHNDKRFSSPPRTHDKSSSSSSSGHVQDSPGSHSSSSDNNSSSRTEIPQIASPNQDDDESSRFDKPPESPTNDVFGTDPPPKVIPTFVDEDGNWE